MFLPEPEDITLSLSTPDREEAPEPSLSRDTAPLTDKGAPRKKAAQQTLEPASNERGPSIRKSARFKEQPAAAIEARASSGRVRKRKASEIEEPDLEVGVAGAVSASIPEALTRNMRTRKYVHSSLVANVYF